MSQNLVQIPLNHLSSGCLREVKNKRKFQTFSFKSGRGNLREVVAYKRFKHSDLTWKCWVFFENWSLRLMRGGHNCRFDYI